MPRITGRPPKPTELKRRLGNPGRRPLPTTVIALRPAVLIEGGEQHETGDALIEALLATPASAWIGEPARLSTLDVLRDLWSERKALRRGLAELPPEWIAGRYVPAGHTRLAKVEAQVLECISMLGLDPVSMSRLGLAEVKARSKLEELRERRAKLVGPRAG